MKVESIRELWNGDWQLDYTEGSDDYRVTFGGPDSELRLEQYAAFINLDISDTIHYETLRG